MTIDEVKAERDALVGELRSKVAPMIEAFEEKTGVVANINTRHVNMTAFGDRVARWKVDIGVDLDWEA